MFNKCNPHIQAPTGIGPLVNDDDDDESSYIFIVRTQLNKYEDQEYN